MTANAFSTFPLVALGSLARIQPGFAFESARFTTDPNDLPLVKGENVQQGYIDWTAAKYWPMNEAGQLDAFVLHIGDVVVAMDRPWVQAGLKWAYLKAEDPKALLVQRVARLVAREGLDQTYLRCLISSAYFAAYVQPIVTGVNVPHISGKQIGDFLIPLPDLFAQRQIAAILSAYDDLIANNQRRITLLEGMAEEIYREWFVRMRFPSEADVVIEQGVPAGWSLIPTVEAFKYHGGATPSTDVPRYWNGGTVQWYTPTDITGASGIFMDESSEKCTDEGLESCSATLFPAYTVMMTSRATIGAIGINLEPACTNQGFIACIPNDRYPLTYLYHWLKLAKPHFQMLSGGATFPELTKGTFKRIKVLTPPPKLIERFDNLVRPMFQQMEFLTRATRQLKESRGALLPRLISGKLKVNQLDIRLPPSMRETAEAEAAA